MKQAAFLIGLLIGSPCFASSRLLSSGSGQSSLRFKGAPAASAPSFSPAQTSGIKVWLKADVGVYSDAGTTPSTNGGIVQQWNDQSGNGNHASQTSVGQQPIYRTGEQNGLPGIRFDSTDDYLSGTLSVLTSFTYYAVVKATTNSTINGTILFHGNNAGSAGCVLQRASNATLTLSESGSGNSVNGMTTGTTFTVAAHFNGASSALSLNSNAATSINAGSASMTAFSLNRSDQSEPLSTNKGDWEYFEVIIYTGSVSAGDEANILAYLQSKWGHY